MVVKEFPKKNIIRRWFRENYPCCPLFGVIPFQFLGRGSLVKNPFKWRCLQIIEHARELWNVRHPLDMAPFSYSWPRPDEVDWYPKDELLTARGIFLHVLDIFGASQVDNPDLDPDQIKHSEILWHARDYGRSFGSLKEVEDYKMFAIFCIWLAYHCLKEVLSEEEKADSPEILKNLLLAEAFLKKIENIQRVELKDKLKTGGRKGGWMRRKIPAVMLAIEHAVELSKNKSTLGLWQYLKKKSHHGQYHFVTKDSDIFFETKDGEIENLMTIRTFMPTGKTGKTEVMKDQQITFSAFKTYVSAYRKKIDK